MPEISLVQALRLILRFVDSDDVGAVIRTALGELERLYQIERLAYEMARHGRQNLVDDDLINSFEALTTIRSGE